MRKASKRAKVKVAPTTRRPIKQRAVEVKEDQAVHCLLRVRSENGLTLAAHKDILSRRGTVFLGKMGEALGPAFREKLNQQIERGVKTYLFLVTREGWNGPYVADRCLLRGVHEHLDSAKQPLVPRYYASDISRIRTWLQINRMERLSREEMNRIFVISSRREIMSVIKSSATVFCVGVRAK
jgi:hypothetical protein